MTRAADVADRLFPAIRELEDYLGDPACSEATVSYEQMAALDEAEEFPDAAYALLDGWGVQDYYVPPAVGGRARSLEDVLLVLRTLARRDLTLTIAHTKTALGCIGVWVGGSPAQQRTLADLVMRDVVPVALGLTERDVGADLAQVTVTATPRAGGYVLRGEKWLVNNATRSRALTVLGRVTGDGGRALPTLFLVDKARLDAAAYTCTPKIRTLGIRAADMSGIRFADAFVPADAVVGEPGSGLSTVLRGLYVTRSMIPGLSLGAADTALRCSVDFALGRRLQGGRVWDLPHARQTLTEAYADLLACECLALATARSLNVLPAQMCMASAASKYFVPATSEAIVKTLAAILGARSYTRLDHWHGAFQRLMRDNAVPPIFDGSTIVNLHALGLQLRALPFLRRRAPALGGQEPMHAIFRVGAPVEPWDPRRLQVSMDGPLLYMERLDELADAVGARHAGLGALAREIVAGVAGVEADIQALNARDARAAARSYALIEYARRYCAYCAGVASLRTWLESGERLGGDFARGDWLVVALGRLLRPGRVDPSPDYLETIERVSADLLRRFEGRQAFSVVPLRLGEGAGRAAETPRQARAV